jgi:hypothetical protein
VSLRGAILCTVTVHINACARTHLQCLPADASQRQDVAPINQYFKVVLLLIQLSQNLEA